MRPMLHYLPAGTLADNVLFYGDKTSSNFRHGRSGRWALVPRK